MMHTTWRTRSTVSAATKHHRNSGKSMPDTRELLTEQGRQGKIDELQHHQKPVLWSVTYNGALRLILPLNVWLVGFTWWHWWVWRGGGASHDTLNKTAGARPPQNGSDSGEKSQIWAPVGGNHGQIHDYLQVASCTSMTMWKTLAKGQVWRSWRSWNSSTVDSST